MSIQMGHEKDICMIGRINEKEMWALNLNCMENKILRLIPPYSFQESYYILIFKKHFLSTHSNLSQL